MLEEELSGRASVNVSDLINQLRRKQPPVPVAKDNGISYLPKAVNVCLLDRRHGYLPEVTPLEPEAGPLTS